MRAITATATAAAPQTLIRLDNYASAPCAVAAEPVFNGTENDGSPNVWPHSWLAGNATWTAATAILNPQGVVGGVNLLRENASNSRHGYSDDIIALAASQVTYSVYAKQASGQARNLQLVLEASSGVAATPWAQFDLAAGVVIATGGGTPSTARIFYAGNGWWKCVLMSDLTPATVYYCDYWLIQPGIVIADPRNPIYPGDNVSGLYMWRNWEVMSLTGQGGPQLTIATSFDDPNDLVNPIDQGSMIWDTSLSKAVVATNPTSFVMAVSPIWARLTLNNGIGGARATFLQVGQHSHSNITAGAFSPFREIADDLGYGSNFRAMAK